MIFVCIILFNRSQHLQIDHGCGSPVGLSAGVGVVALLGSIHRGRSVQGLNRYRRRLAPGLGGGSRAEGPNPPPGSTKKKTFADRGLVKMMDINETTNIYNFDLSYGITIIRNIA